MQERSFSGIIRALSGGGIEFILVGGLAAAVAGAPIDTLDVDVVHSRTTDNIQRLLGVLDSLDAILRVQPARRLKPNASHLAGTGDINLQTRYGPFDVLCTIGNDLGYEELLPHSYETEIRGMRIRVLDLETLIAVKESVGGEKDRAVLPILRRTLEEKRKLGQ
jgi:predicted nucleotidyltransferase